MGSLPWQPRCGCFECLSYSMVYSSIADLHKCLECKATINNKHIENIVTAYGIFKSASPPILIPNYNALVCISCLRTGGLGFGSGGVAELVRCGLCKYNSPFSAFHDAMVMAYRTKLVEETYHQNYSVFLRSRG